MRIKQKGNKVRIQYAKRNPTTFTAGGRKRVPLDDGMAVVNCTVKFADGTLAYGVIELDESSSGENHGIGIFMLDGSFHWQGDTSSFLKKLHKTATEVFPYTYRYDAKVRCEDHHVDAVTGWSR